MKKGFTYIDILLIFGIFLVGCIIITPIVLNRLESYEIEKVTQDAYGYIDTVDKQIILNSLDNNSSNDIKDGVYGISDLNALDVLFRGTIPTGGTVSIEGGYVKDYTLEYNRYTVNYDEEIKDVSITKDGKVLEPVANDIYKEELLMGNDPVLKDDLVPVLISETGEVTIASLSNDWYNYSEKRYANAVILDKSVSVSPGNRVEEDEIKAYFVWIPKFSYKIDVDNETVDISFEVKEDHIEHPTFTSTGIWVGKFETGDEEVVKPNVESLRNVSISEAHTIAYNYYREFDSHMMKNTEWGAVAYFSSSVYGNEDITLNESEYITGSGVGTLYNTQNPTQSTNGNITGIYDMAGGSWEFMMAVVSDSLGNPVAGVSSIQTSGFNGLNTIDYTKVEENLDFPDSKYYDLYESGTNLLGDATRELKVLGNTGWNSDIIYNAVSNYPFYERGGDYTGKEKAGIFRSRGCSGNAGDATFRIILSE